jgi:hypothetical protein
MFARKLRPFLLSLTALAASEAGLPAADAPAQSRPVTNLTAGATGIALPAVSGVQGKKTTAPPFDGGPAVSTDWTLISSASKLAHTKRTGPLRPNLAAQLAEQSRSAGSDSEIRIPLAATHAASGKPASKSAPKSSSDAQTSVAFTVNSTPSRARTAKPDVGLSVLESSAPVATRHPARPQGTTAVAAAAKRPPQNAPRPPAPVAKPAVAEVTLPELAPRPVPEGPATIDRPAAPQIFAASSGKPAPVTTATAVTVVSPPAAPARTEVQLATAASGHGKPSLPAPVTTDIAPVNWSAARNADTAKLSNPAQPFEVECVPFVAWDPATPGELLAESALENLPLGGSSDLAGSYTRNVTPAPAVASAVEPSRQQPVQHKPAPIAQPKTLAAPAPAPAAEAPAQAGRSQLTALKSSATRKVDPADIADLRQLRPAAQLESGSARHYLADLNQLVEGNSDWLFVNPELLDLAPHEGNAEAPGYLQELHGLTTTQHVAAHPQAASAPQRILTVAKPGRPVHSAQDDREHYQVQADAACETSGTQTLATLFQPLSQIDAGGSSTAPPELPANHKTGDSTELRRPENLACAYMETTTPVCYFPPVRFGTHRPPRNVHTLYTNPLYYEDPNLERCGVGQGCLTTAVSAVHFGTAIAFTPYMAIRTCPDTCVPTLPDCPACHEFDEWICPASGQ